ncbi:CDP-alcohol phosphatidyltransferase family protein [Nocardiopsis ansamitocini]|uniref:CDP-alcohol phosphatidyltransferase family protein n=1 Tax=Nocardiopsis ansamitocini TaxID=1670832 RepID=UPI0032DABB0A
MREQTYKARDAWWTVFLVDPVAARLTLVTANRTSITPNQITMGAMVLGMGAAVCFATGQPQWLIAGAVLFHLSFILDCMDGKIARLKGTGSVFGTWLDFVFDQIRVLACAVGLMGGQYAATGNPVFIWFAVGIVFTDMFRYLNGSQMAKVRKAMQKRLTAALRDAEEHTAAGDAELQHLQEKVAKSEPVAAAGEEEPAPAQEPEVIVPSHSARAREIRATKLQQRFNSHFPWYLRFRNQLLASRVRTHLFSGIEFQMSVAIIAPVVGAFSATGMLVVIAAAAALMLAFELLLIYKLWLSTRAFTKTLAEIEELGAANTPPEEQGTTLVLSEQKG